MLREIAHSVSNKVRCDPTDRGKTSSLAWGVTLREFARSWTLQACRARRGGFSSYIMRCSLFMLPASAHQSLRTHTAHTHSTAVSASGSCELSRPCRATVVTTYDCQLRLCAMLILALEQRSTVLASVQSCTGGLNG